MEVPSIFLNRILTETAKSGASSLHLTVGVAPTIRKDGQLSHVEEGNIITADLVNKIMASFVTEEEMVRLTKNKEIVLIKQFAGNFRFRVNIFYQKKLPSLSFHFIPENLNSFESLKLPQALKDLMESNSGLFIVAGSKFSGKTTTASIIVEEINRNYKKRIVTIENPIEHLFVGKKSLIEQRQVGDDVTSVLAGVQYCFEEDVDVIYIGEIREEFDVAIPTILELAAGNSLVILEINAESSIRAIEKVLNPLKDKMGAEVARYHLADVLSGVLVQELIPRLGGGMAMANEVVITTPPVKSLIREGKVYQLDSVIQTSRKDGMISMSKSKEDLIAAGEIKPEKLKES